MSNVYKCKYVINGRQLSGQMGGVQRYLRETLSELDKISEKGEVLVAVPKNASDIPEYENIKILRFGLFGGILWEQLDYALFLVKNHLKGVNLCTAVPLLYPKGINAIHDVMPIRYPEVRKAFKPWNYLLLKMNYYMATKGADRVITVSETSKADIVHFYKVPAEKIDVIPNAWQHMDRVKPVRFDGEYAAPGKYYLGLSSRRWQKNFKWIEEVARRNPDAEFVIVGGQDTQQNLGNTEEGTDPVKNVHYTGFRGDGEIKWLYSNCKAFLFPSICEGFGIPPIEALSCGANLIVSNTSCMPEIIGNAGVYIDPYDYDVDIEKLNEECGRISEDSKKETLGRYSWEKSAILLRNLIRN